MSDVELCPACSEFHQDCLRSQANILRYPASRPIFWGMSRPNCFLGALLFDLERHWWQGHQDFRVKEAKLGGSCRMPLNDYSVSASPDSPLAKLQGEPLMLSNFTSKSSIAKLQSWLQECDTEPLHKLCRERDLLMPSRVIDVIGADEGQQVKLIETAGLVEDYVVLSHCWGTSEKFITTTSTLPKFQSGIKLESLPKTFRDAIWLTRKVGKRYLWIDSLCIIQDDGNDWLVESKEMSRIYSNSYLSIAASNSSDDKEGFLQPYKEYRSLVIKPPWSDSEHVYVQDQPSQSFMDKWYFFYDERIKETEKFREMGGLACGLPLDKRGWTLQEAILPHRAIRYGYYGMNWACKYRHGSATGIWNDFWHLKTELHWRKIVAQYSRRSLTFEKDKLPAISGLTKMFGGQTNKRYCAGLWWEGIGGDLLWKKGANSFLVKPNGRSGPSWSWASFDGRIDFTLIEINPYTMVYESKFMDFSTVLRTENPYGEVESGSITLEGPLLPEVDGENLDESSGTYRGKAERQFDINARPVKDVFELVILRTTDWIVSASLTVDSTGPTVWATLYGILVVEVEDSPDTFERVGHWSRKVRASPENTGLLEIFRRKILLV